MPHIEIQIFNLKKFQKRNGWYFVHLIILCCISTMVLKTATWGKHVSEHVSPAWNKTWQHILVLFWKRREALGCGYVALIQYFNHHIVHWRAASVAQRLCRRKMVAGYQEKKSWPPTQGVVFVELFEMCSCNYKYTLPTQRVRASQTKIGRASCRERV